MKTMRTICGLNKQDSLKALLISIDIIEKNFLLDDSISGKDYDILVSYLVEFYRDVKKEYEKEMKNVKH